MNDRIKYYHGGIKGLFRGDKILPPCITGKSTLLQYAKEIDPDGVQRDDMIYITTDKKAAKMFAAAYPLGDVYEVVPDGQIENDLDCLEDGLSYQCKSAMIKYVVARGIRL